MSQSTRSAEHSAAHNGGLGGSRDLGRDDDELRAFSRSVADRLVGVANPAAVLDVGCGTGLLVRALREKGVDAVGLDVSGQAIEASHPDVRPHLHVASATEPIEGRYSLVTCIEVLPHLSPAEAQVAIDRMCEVTDRVVLSADPADHRQPTHVTTRPTATWAAAFAERGLFRRTDVDLSSLSPWAVMFERADLTVHEVAQRYETHYAELQAELVEKRAALLDAYRQVGEWSAGHPSAARFEEQAALVEQWQAEVLEARHQLLTTRDHVIGAEAQVARLDRDLANVRVELRRVRKMVKNLRERVQQGRQRQQRLTRSNARLTRELEAAQSRTSLTRRVARRLLRGGAR